MAVDLVAPQKHQQVSKIAMLSFLKADVILKFVDEEAPAAIQPKTLYIPKPDIQVILKG